jgi:hypothetical protein
MLRWPVSVATVLLIFGLTVAQEAPRAVTLGRPRPLSEAPAVPAPQPDVIPAAFDPDPPQAARILGPSLDVPPPFNPAAADPPNSWRAPEPAPDASKPERPKPQKKESPFLHVSKFGEAIGELLHPSDGRETNWKAWFQSDHCFDCMISPVTNPFLFEDPRALTELRPIFMIQHIPNSNPVFRGGNAEFFGTQARVAITERFSFTINKLGWTAINTGSGSSEPGGVGFSELQLGPKFTFLRSVDDKLLGAAGIIFQIPDGRGSVYQDTGSLSIVPYASFGKNFFENRFGSLNFLNTTGYSFATDRERTDFFYSSFHLDWDVANLHRYYPLLEFNWFQYMRSGGVRPLNTEGRDLANIGSTGMSGKGNFHGAIGMRYKFSESAQVGAAWEFPLSGRRDLLDYRFTIDFIWRY